MIDPFARPDPYWLAEGQEVTVDVPPDAVLEYGGATRQGNSITFRPSPVRLPAADLVWGKFRLGRFVMDSVVGQTDGSGTHYTAVLRRLEQSPVPEREPVDDAVATWIKRWRDTFKRADGGERGDDSWLLLDNLLDDYRDHRVTGTPLDRGVETH